jgi:hypothetical protein
VDRKNGRRTGCSGFFCGNSFFTIGGRAQADNWQKALICRLN